jgi:hypothetical protein
MLPYLSKKDCLLLKYNSSKDQLHTSLFYSTCNFKDKVCNTIINSCSCENVVSTKVVEKLQLKLERHHKPYKLNWLNQDTKVIIERSCVVSFSISKIKFDNV